MGATWLGAISLLLLLSSVCVSLFLQERTELESPNLCGIGLALVLALVAGFKGPRLWWLIVATVFCVWYLWLLALGH